MRVVGTEAHRSRSMEGGRGSHLGAVSLAEVVRGAEMTPRAVVSKKKRKLVSVSLTLAEIEDLWPMVVENLEAAGRG